MGKKEQLKGQITFELLEGKGLENQSPEVVVYFTANQPEFICRAPQVASDGTFQFMQSFSWSVLSGDQPVLTARVFDVNTGQMSGTINLDFKSLKNPPHVRDTWVPLEREPGRYIGSLHIRVTFTPEKTIDLGVGAPPEEKARKEGRTGLFSFGRKKKEGTQFSTDLYGSNYTPPTQPQPSPLVFPPREAASPNGPLYGTGYTPGAPGPYGGPPSPYVPAPPAPAYNGSPPRPDSFGGNPRAPGEYDPERDFNEPPRRSVLDEPQPPSPRLNSPGPGLFSCWGPSASTKQKGESISCASYFGALGRL